MFSRFAFVRMVVLALALGAASRPACAADRLATIAVFPVENLSGASIPGDRIRLLMIERLSAAGAVVFAGGALDDFMTRHRIRYAAGIDAPTAEAMRTEAGVDAVLFTSVESWSDVVPPKVAITARLVSIQAAPFVAWANDVAMAGDDAPGLLELGLVNDPATLLGRALNDVSKSLVTYVATGQAPPARKPDAKFAPRDRYTKVSLEAGKVYTVAVLPFFNLADRRNAGEILALLFARHLSAMSGFRVLDAGDVRQELLQARIIMDQGVSLGDAELVGAALDADFVLGGRVLAYRDYEGQDANPRVDFSTVLIDRRTRKVVWSSRSDNDGMDGVRFFGRGRVGTAHALATQMVRLVAEGIAR